MLCFGLDLIYELALPRIGNLLVGGGQRSDSNSCIGFGAGFPRTLVFGVTLDQFGGRSPPRRRRAPDELESARPSQPLGSVT
jgi:hypothetical protein